MLDVIRLSSKNAAREAVRNKSQYCLGCTSVYIVVIMVSLLLTAISYSPVVFLTLSEVGSGEVDLTVSAGSWTNFDRINYTLAQQQMPNELFAPRYSGIGASMYSNCQAKIPDCNNTLQCQRQRCLFQAPVAVLMTFLDSDRERQLGIGRAWSYGKIERNSIYLHQSVADSLGVAVGSEVAIGFNFAQVLPVTTKNLYANNTDTIRSSYVDVTLKVAQVLPSNMGKLPATEKSSVFLELSEIINIVYENMSPQYSVAFREGMNASQGQQYEQVIALYFACASYRVGCYLSSDYGAISNSLIDWASNVIQQFGYTDVDTQMDLLGSLYSQRLFSAFLNLIFGIVMVILGGLSVFLIYSLLMVSVETKTFELGIFRMVGMSKVGLVCLILMQAMFYAIPAWILGLLTAQAVWLWVKVQLASLINADVQFSLTPSSIVLATVLGILVPAISSVLPIRTAFGANLREALDTRRSKQKHIVVTIERAGQGRLPTPLLITGLILVIFGFGIYYFLPMALVTSNIPLLFNIFLILLVGMLLGLVMLSLNLAPLTERAIVWIMFLLLQFENRSLPGLVIKNLVAHKMRNRKTSIMYGLALGFIIFLTVALRIELQSLIFATTQQFGGDITITSSSYFRDDFGVPLGMDVEKFSQYCSDSLDVSGYFLVSFTPQIINATYTGTQIQNVGKIVKSSVSVRAASPNVFNINDPKYLVISSEEQQLRYFGMVGERMYSAEGSISAPVGTFYQNELSIQSFEDRFVVQFEQSQNGATSAKLFGKEALAFIESAPYFTFSKFPNDPTQALPISYTQLMAMINDTLRTIDQVPIETMAIKLKDASNQALVQKIVRDLKSLAIVEEVKALQDQLVGIVSAQSTLSYIFLLITLMSMTVAFFSLNSSMYTNIQEQKKEIGVLRALGITKFCMMRLFCYEAFTLILSSSLLGTFIGVVLGWSMAAQRSVVTQVPLQFAFPLDIFGLVIVVAVISSILSTAGPIYQLVFGKQIVNLMR